LTLGADLHRAIVSTWVMMRLSSTDTTVFVSLAPRVNLNEEDFPSVVCKSAYTPHSLSHPSLSRKSTQQKWGHDE